jgi:hypothetical protein
MYVTTDFAQQKDGQAVTLNVSNELNVTVLTYSEHEFLMSTNDVAKGYGISPDSVHSQKHYNSAELKEGVHFVKGLGISKTLTMKGLQPNAIYWTKAGVVRLGFFIKSERAKMFRDWAEQVVLAVMAPKVSLPRAARRNHNRITPARMVRILATVALVKDEKVRTSLVQQLMPDLDIPGLQLELPFGGKGGNQR